MKLSYLKITKADTCGGLLDGLEVRFRGGKAEGRREQFDPICLVGPNGAGKSQLLQVLAEVFQSVFHACLPDEEPMDANADLQFELEYRISTKRNGPPVDVRLSRLSEGKRRPALRVQRKVRSTWVDCRIEHRSTHALLPSSVVGYTSGGNETLSLPFLVSRRGYADRVGMQAFSAGPNGEAAPVPNTRHMLIDYGTHLEVLVANLVLGTPEERLELLQYARLREVHSFRCVIQLAHSAAPKVSLRGEARKGIQLTAELKRYIEQLRACATCHSFDPKTETYTFDFWVDRHARRAFKFFWKRTMDLYSALHKLAMLNDLAIPRTARERLNHDLKTRRFASRLPEPQDEDRVFRFEQVRFVSEEGGVVDYVSLSDGEHQLAQILGTMCMASQPNVLFLLDEPESHFNPQWRIRLVSLLMDMPTATGRRADKRNPSSEQECLLTTHSPFVPSDMSRDNVLIFRKVGRRVEIRRPTIETYGTTFDTILEECFGVRPPISAVSHGEIKRLMASKNPTAIRLGLARLGDSVEKVFLVDRLQQLSKRGR